MIYFLPPNPPLQLGLKEIPSWAGMVKKGASPPPDYPSGVCSLTSWVVPAGLLLPCNSELQD